MISRFFSKDIRRLQKRVRNQRVVIRWLQNDLEVAREWSTYYRQQCLHFERQNKALKKKFNITPFNDTKDLYE